MKYKKGIYNIVFGLLGQVIILAIGLIVPRLLLRNYGDETNGLINAISQLFTYLALIEAGVGQAAVQSLYKPVATGEQEEISSILSATQNMFRKLTKLYLALVVVISFGYPLIIKVPQTDEISFFGSSYWSVFFIVFIQGISNAISFYFVATFRQILLADGRSYISTNIATFTKILTSVLRIVLINIGVNLIAVQLIYVFINTIEVLIYQFCIKKRYPWIDMKASPNKQALNQRNSFVVHEIANVIFNSTDVFVLSIVCSLEVASIYSVYNLVFHSINTLVGQVHNGCFFILGQTYKKERERYDKIHDLYDTCYISIVFIVMSVTYVLILPFISLYTAGVTDIVYVNQYLPILFCSIHLLSCCRITSSNLIKIAGCAKDTIKNAIIEASINLSVSILLAYWIGIYGVLIGTIIALLYRTNDMIIYANKKILNRSPLKTYGIILVNIIGFIVVMLTASVFSKGITSYGIFLGRGVLLLLIFSLFYLLWNILFGTDLKKALTLIIKRKFGRKE